MKMFYIKKLPDREKNPETCCASVKKGKQYVNPVCNLNYYYIINIFFLKKYL